MEYDAKDRRRARKRNIEARERHRKGELEERAKHHLIGAAPCDPRIGNKKRPSSRLYKPIIPRIETKLKRRQKVGWVGMGRKYRGRLKETE